jgi:hypothetical protein
LYILWLCLLGPILLQARSICCPYSVLTSGRQEGSPLGVGMGHGNSSPVS